MPDTVYYHNSAGQDVPYDSLPPDIKAMVEKDVSEINQKVYAREQSKGKNQDIFSVATVLVIILLIVARIIRAVLDTKSSGESDFNTDTYGNTEQNKPTDPPDYYIYEGAKLGLNHDDITNILTKHYPYYNHLNPLLKNRFADRLAHFIGGKTFIIYSQEPYKEMPVLTSATAVQLTFGLDDYMLPWFSYIRVHPQEYFATGSLRVLAGNVDGNTITIAWNQLLQGIKDENDGINVGLHEMAHALYYQHAEVQGERTGKFAGHFDEVMEEGEEVYKLKTTQHVLFTDYAYRNLQEFWAESVEIFFERAVEMQRCYPRIYDTLKELLQQNPVNKENPLDCTLIGG